MKSSKRNLILKIFGYLFISVMLISCQNSSESNEDNIFNEYTNLFISINDYERTIMPETLSLTDLSFKLYGAKAGETQEVLKEWNNSTSISSSSITLKSGIWNFTMNAYLAGKLVLTSSKENVFLQGSNSTIRFVLDEPNNLLGSVDVTFTFPVSSGNIPGAKKIVAKLIKDSTEEIEIDSQIMIPANVTNDNTKQFVRYQKLNIEEGYYFLRFYIYQLENADYTNFHSTYIRVEPGLESKGNERINSFFDRRHKLTLLLNGGIWNENYNVPNDFSELTNTELPIGKATFQSEYWRDAILDGWYEMPEDGDLTKVQIITSLPSGNTEDKVLYAKWTIKCIEDDIQQAFDNFPEGRFDIKLTDYHHNQGNDLYDFNFKLDHPKKIVGLDYSEAYCGNDWKTFPCQNGLSSNSVISLNLSNATFVGYIGWVCWEKCRNVEFNNSLLRIQDSAFRYSKALTEIHLPHSLQEIGNNAFKSSPNFHTVYFEGSVEEFNEIQMTKGSNNFPFDEGVLIICNNGNLIAKNYTFIQSL